MDKAEVIRRGYDAAARRDAVQARALLAPDARWYSAMGLMTLGRELFVGYEDIARLVFEEIPAVLDGFSPDVLEVRDLGGELALAIVRWRGTIRASDMVVDQVFGQLCRIRDGKWQEMRSYPTPEDALAAVTEVRVRHLYEAWNARDYDGIIHMTLPTVELVQDPRIAGAETVRGQAALREWLVGFSETWAEFHLTPQRIDTAGDVATAHLRIEAVARGSGMRIGSVIAHRFVFEDGLIRACRTYADAEAAPAP